ncbi:MAG: hypothetical protein RL166_909 [Actinomycetota bacterium]|jgi:hypothetical protein
MFKALFDFKFQTLVTKQVVGVVYAVIVIALTVVALVAGVAILPALPAIAAAWFILVVLIRVSLEGVVALTQIAENTKK